MTPTSKITYPYQNPRSSNTGFVLITTLGLLTLAVAVLISLVTILQLQQNEINNHLHRSLARRNALIGLDIAISEIQSSSGMDQVSTSPAQTLLSNPIHPYWTCVMDDQSKWLVSHIAGKNPDPFTEIETEHKLLIVGKGTTGENSNDKHVYVEKAPLIINSQPCGNYGFWVGELNTKANLTVIDKLQNSTTISEFQKCVANLSFPQEPAASVVFEDTSKLDNPEFKSKLAVQAQFYEVELEKSSAQEHFHDITTYSRGLLTNSLTGGFKINLTDRNYRDSLITDDVSKQIHPDSKQTSEGSLSPETYKIKGNQFSSGNTEPTLGSMIETLAPMLTEFRLSVGIFSNTTGMSRGDYFHRARFHIHSEWLNPFPYDIGFQYPNGYYLFIDNLPEIEIRNVNAGISITADLGDIDENLRNNTANESNFNTYLKFSELIDKTESIPYGLESGRIYKMSSPNDGSNGLARTLSEEEWANKTTTAPVDGSRPLVEYATSSKTEYFPPIYLDDLIRISSQEDSFKIDLTLCPISDELNAGMESSWEIPMGTEMTPMEYIEEYGISLKLINIPFSKIDFTIPGSIYPRHTSSYTEADFRIAFHFRLKDDPASLSILAEQISLNNYILDFDDPQIQQLFEITSNPREAATLAVGFSGLDLFYDSENEKNTSSPDDYEFNLYDLPLVDPISVGVFSQLHFHGKPHPSIGSTTAKNWNQIYDTYYFSGTQASDAWESNLTEWSSTKHTLNFLTNNRVVPIVINDASIPTPEQLTKWDGAQLSYLEGMFNIHSPSVKAWESILTNTLKNNDMLKITDSTGENNYANNVFSRLPFASPLIENQLSDSGIALSNDPQKKHFRQGSRSLDNGNWIHLLAESIVLEIKKHSEINGLFQSISELANSGILQTAIQNTTLEGVTINHGISPLAPTYLRQSDLLSHLAPFVTTRSDSFIVRAYGESIDPRNNTRKSQTMCEAIVQRTPPYIDPKTNNPTDLPSELNQINASLGRRYKIVQFRWLQPHEI